MFRVCAVVMLTNQFLLHISGIINSLDMIAYGGAGPIAAGLIMLIIGIMFALMALTVMIVLIKVKYAVLSMLLRLSYLLYCVTYPIRGVVLPAAQPVVLRCLPHL